MEKVEFFRKKYSQFIYESFSSKVFNNDLEISFKFVIEPGIIFNPKVTIKNINKKKLEIVGDKVLNNLIFHLGLIELLSYWKATCSPEIIIKAGFLNSEQIKWWKDLIIQGIGQFFYENRINFQKPNFIRIISTQKYNRTRIFLPSLKNRFLVPVGGGKDSIVTLEILKETKKELSSFSLNPTDAALKIMKIAGCKNQIIVERKIDKKLLELNRQGFLNGHTPFSAYLAFLSVLCGAIFDYKYIAFSNERSSNEGNLIYLGKIINHQWSKSFKFEKKFREYSRKYLTSGVKEDKSSFPPSLPLRGSSVVEYFSFLRPLYEIQIVKLFSKYPKYFPVFLSCNEAYKTASGTEKPTKKWCGKCPKCLFIFTILYPLVTEKKLIKIFGKNLFNDKNLLPIMKELIGKRGFKPFECVGTKKETLIAFYLSWKKNRGRASVTSVKLPFLLKYFEKKILPKHPNLEREVRKLMNSWNKQNNIPKEFEKILKALLLTEIE